MNLTLSMSKLYSLYKFFIAIFLIFFFEHSFSQYNYSEVFSSNVKNLRKSPLPISFSGAYRFLGYVRNQKNTFQTSGKTLDILSGDKFREPMLLLKLKGLTKDNISFGADFMINSAYKGPSVAANTDLTLNLGLNLRTSFNTEFGKFKFSSGGMNWYRQSRLTVWGNRSFNRTSIFHRRPSTALNRTPIARYENYYKNGLIDQGVRYGSRAFKGLFFSGQNLPYKLSFKGVVGKSSFNRSVFTTSDNFTGCFKINKRFKKKLNISYNFLNSFASLDSLTNDLKEYTIHSMEFSKKWKKFSLKLETALGNYSSPEYDLSYGEAFILNFKTAKSFKTPLELQVYRISPQFVNLTGNLFNTTVSEVFPNISGIGTTVRTPFNSPIIGLGAHTNNRQGISLNAEHSFGKFNINGGIGFFTEIDTSNASISYRYNINAETLSRLQLFAQNWGPYNSLNTTYRNIFEEVSISDTNALGNSNFKKFFNTVELQLKYKNIVRGHKFYIFSLSRFNSCQKKLNVLPQYNLDAFISMFSQEFDFNFQLNNNTCIIFTYGIERVIGNSSTGLGDQDLTLGGNPINVLFETLGFKKFNPNNFSRNQRNRLIGFGVDYKIGKRAMLFLRHNLYKYYDPNFISYNLEGSETMLELKILF